MTANIVMLGVLASLSHVVTAESLRKSIETSVPKGTEEINLKAFEAGYTFQEKTEKGYNE